MVRRCDLFLRIERTIDGPLHIRLAGADPNFAEEDILELNGVLALHHHGVRFAVCAQSREFRAPRPFLGGGGGDTLATERDGDSFSRIARSPNPDRGPLLENHVVTEHLRNGDVREGGRD